MVRKGCLLMVFCFFDVSQIVSQKSCSKATENPLQTDLRKKSQFIQVTEQSWRRCLRHCSYRRLMSGNFNKRPSIKMTFYWIVL